MESLRTRFEMALRSKLFNKTNSFNDEKAVLLKSLQHFDIYKTGYIDFNGWVKGLEKAGLIMEFPKQLKQLFDYYDTQHKGEIDYKNFVTQLFSKQIHSEESEEDSVESVLNKMRQKLIDRGIRGLIGLAKYFALSGRELLSYSEFKRCLLQTQFDYPEEDLLKVYSRFESAEERKVEYKEFINYFRVWVCVKCLEEYE